MSNPIRNLFYFLMIMLLLPAVTNALNDQGKLKAAVVKVDITPSEPKMLLGYAARKSTGVHSGIHHKIVVLDDGTTRFFLVASDLCVLSPSEYDHVATLLKKKLGIDPLQFWWSVTHTHSAPEVGVPGLPESFMQERYEHEVDTAYTRFVEESLLRGVQQAIAQLEPATLSVGWGYAEANINRRTWGVDHKAVFGMNPDGPVDRRIGLLKLQKANGSLMGMIANYALHATVLGPGNLKISADVAGVVANYVEEKTGAPLVFINGAAGNLAPIYSVYPSPGAGHLDQFKVLLGDKILHAATELYEVLDSVRIVTGEQIVKTPRKETLTQWPSYLNRYSPAAKKGEKPMVHLPVRFLKLHPSLVIWSAPLELFCEISNNVRDQSPYLYTLYFGYTNGWLGYLASAAEWKYGGYETHKVSPYEVVAEKDITTTVLQYLHSPELNKQANTKKKKP